MLFTGVFVEVPFPVISVNAQSQRSVEEVRFRKAEPGSGGESWPMIPCTLSLLAPPEEVGLADFNHADEVVLGAVAGADAEGGRWGAL